MYRYTAGADTADAEPAAGGAGNGPSKPHGEPFGLACVLEIFRFSVSFISLEDGSDENAESMCAFGLQLVLASLESAGDDFARHAPLLTLVQDDLSRAVLAVAPAGHPPVLAATAATVLQLYMVMHLELKLQLEAFLRMVLLPLGEGRGEIPQESQRIALECIVDLCRQPNFVPDLYMNFDCDLERPNLFEELTALLSRNAFPVNCPLNATHLLSLEGLLAVVAGIADRSATAPPMPMGGGGGAAAEPAFDAIPTEYVDIWGDAEIGGSNGGASAAAAGASGVARATHLRRNRHLKRRLLACAEHFNRSYKKGLAYMQEIKLLPEPLEPKAVARFLKFAPNLDKEVVGEYIGDHKDFSVAVLTEYCNIFDFKGVTLDRALRSFLDGFKLPGEAQKISRILEVFAARYYTANPEAVEDADSAYVLSYSIIMLNTDQHNPQVKRKMTLEQFIRNNRGTNGGKDWPRETLEAIFVGIVNDEIKLTDDAAPTLTASKWADMMRSSSGGKGRMLATPEVEEAMLYDTDLFGIVWSPTIAAVSVVFDHTVDESVLKEALDGFLGIARIAGHHRLTDVMDHLVATLCKFAAPAHLHGDGGGGGGNGGNGGSGSSRPSVQFGEDDRARTAAVTAFTVANRYGDSLRAGWCNLLDLILRLHKLGLLSDKVAAGLTVDERDGGTMRAIDGSKASTSAAQPEKLQKKVSSSSSLLRGFSQLLSLESDYYATAEVPLTEQEKEAEQRAMRCVEACRVDEVFADSKFLEAESLLHMVRALTWAAGPAGAAGAGAAAAENSNGNGGGGSGVMEGAVSAEDEDTALFCLDILIAVTLRNRDRIRLLLPHVYGYLRTIVQSAQVPTPLAERAIFELLRIAQRLLPYKEELAEELLDSLRLMFALEPAVADAFIERIARELCVLVQVAAGHIKGPKGWDTICKLLMASARHPDAAGHGFQALALIMAERESDGGGDGSGGGSSGGGGGGDGVGGEGVYVGGYARPWNIGACIEAAAAFVDAHQGGEERSVAALALLSSASNSVCEWCSGAADGGAMAVAAAVQKGLAPGAPEPSPLEAVTALRAEMLVGSWGDIVTELRRVAETEDRPGVRDDAVLTLQRVLLAAEGLNAPATHWMAVLDGTLLPMLTELGDRCKKARGGAEGRTAHERTARLAVSCVAKTFLQYLGAMLEAATPSQFTQAWLAVLDRMESLLKNAKSEELIEAVPEAVKNMLLVMSAQGVLAPGAPQGLWETTWKRAAVIDPGLTPAIVGAK